MLTFAENILENIAAIVSSYLTNVSRTLPKRLEYYSMGEKIQFTLISS